MSVKKNICFLCGDLSRGGGTERIVTDLSTELAQTEKYNIYLVDVMNWKKEMYFPIGENVYYYSLNDNTTKLIKKIWRLFRFLKRAKIDVLINVDVMLTIYSYLPCKLQKIKNIAWEQFNYFNDIGSKNTRKIRQFALLRLNYYVNLTQADMETFQKNFKIKSPITYIHNFVRINDDTMYNLESRYLITAGNFYADKGMDIAVKVGEEVFKKHPDWKWILCGDGKEFDRVNNMVNTSRFKKNFILPGRVKNIYEYMRNSAIYISLSQSEGFGLTLLEAQNNNLPIVAFDVPFGPKEIVLDGRNGFLIENMNIKDMAEKINFLIENREKRKLFSVESKKKFRDFSAERAVEKWEEILDNI